MHVKFTLLERDLIGIKTHRTIYETNIDVKSNPAIAILKDKIREGVMKELGINEEAAEKDSAFFLSLTVPQGSQLGVRVPSSNYMLVITDEESITRLPESFRLQGL